MPYKLGNRTVYYIGDPECEKLCKLTTKTGAPVIYDEIIKNYNGSNKFVDVDFPADDSSIDVAKLEMDVADASGQSKLKAAGWDGTIAWKRAKEAVVDLAKGKGVFSLREANDTETKSRFDVSQGSIGDCWFVGGLSQITMHKELIDFVVPDDNIENNDSGAYHFRYSRFGEWVDVVVDDFIPMAKISGGGWMMLSCGMKAEHEEFELWPVLAEKAYAKIAGTYASIESNLPRYALEDLTGGISDQIKLNETIEEHPTLYDTLSLLKNITFMNFWTSEDKHAEDVKKNNLFVPHAYPLTGIAKLNGTPLIRLRNPYGKTEWSGPWSDSSDEWKSIPEDKRNELGLVKADDGEFWMPLRDAVHLFHQIDCCYWFSDLKFQEFTEKFEYQKYHSKWSAENNADPWNNPQFPVTLTVADEKGQSALIMSLGVKIGLKEKPQMHSLRAFKIAEKYTQQSIPYGEEVFSDPDTLDVFNINPNLQKDGMEGLAEMLEVRTGKTWSLPVGKYVIIPMCYQQNNEAEFLLQIISQRVPTSAGNDFTTSLIATLEH